MRISIIIPTRERARYLESSLATATAIKDPDVEIVVSDNASGDDTKQVVEANADPRIRYVNTGARVSMRQNFEFALNNSSGDYVIYFGDDDGILPGQFPMLRRILEAQEPDALSWDYPVYGWPVPGGGGRSGCLRFLRKNNFGLPHALDRDARLRVLESGQMKALHPMPAIYHGCMSRAFLDRLATSEGIHFAASCPDIYISFRALQHGGDLVHVHHPFSINGSSPASTGSSLGMQGQDRADRIKPAGDSFLAEIATDPITDVAPVSKSLTLVFLNVLETARHRFPDEPLTPDHRGWFAHALNEMNRKDAATAADIRASLETYARQFGAGQALAAANAQGPETALDRLKRDLSKTGDKIGSFRRSCEIDGRNTILSAARMCDTILGSDQAAILDRTMTRAAAWRAARRRSRQFSPLK